MLTGHKNTLLFYRDFKRFTGGHLKVWDYFCHAGESRSMHPKIFYTPSSLLDATNPWVAANIPTLPEWRPHEANALFLGGLDWLALPDNLTSPIINIIQNVRHGFSDDPRYQFLQRRAIRICVSEEVADCIHSTQRVNGPVFVIPNTIDTKYFPQPGASRDIPLLIAGMKNPVLAKELFSRLDELNLTAICQIEFLPRSEYLSLLGRAQITVFLPHAQEGFYLPALEAMAMGSVVICPDCIGNRQFCQDKITCFRPAYSIEAIENAILSALSMPEDARAKMLKAAGEQVVHHSFSKERKAFLEILDNFSSLW